ncbi:MAG: mngB 8 [Anaerocolumna sp.]|nr:mngB 8 [Anaerocolumna sp.]
MAMGLVRGVRLRIPCDNRLWMEYPGDESAESLGEFTYGYALMPHGGLWEQAGLYKEALIFNTPMHVCQFGKQKGLLPLDKSFLSLEGNNLIFSAFKKAEDRDTVIIRMYNPSEHDITGKLTLGFEFQDGFIVNMREERTEQLKVMDRTLSFPAGHGKIISVELVL